MEEVDVSIATRQRWIPVMFVLKICNGGILCLKGQTKMSIIGLLLTPADGPVRSGSGSGDVTGAHCATGGNVGKCGDETAAGGGTEDLHRPPRRVRP